MIVSNNKTGPPPVKYCAARANPTPGAPPTCSIWFHLELLHTILDERLGIFEAYDDQLE